MKRVFALLCVLLLVSSLAFAAFADFGDFGGDADYGGGWDDGGWGGGWDDDDYGGSSGGSSDDGFIGFIIGLLFDFLLATPAGRVILIILVIIYIIRRIVRKKTGKSGKKNRPNTRPVMPGATPTNVSTLRPVSEYLALDPSFSDTELHEKLSNIYVQMQNAWQAKNLETLRPYFTDELYAQYDRQLDNYRRAKQTNRIERIAVLGIDTVGWKQQGGDDVMVLNVRSRIVDYVVDDATGNVVRGSNTAEKFMTYEYTLTRKTGVKTAESTGTRVVNCPSCGAPCDINKTAKCEYCGNIITVDSCDWVISGIKGISQRTAG